MTKLFRYLKKYWLAIALAIVFVVIQCWGQLTLPDLMSDIVNGIPAASMSNDLSELYRTGGKMLAVSGIIAGVTILATLFAARTAAGFAKDLRQALFEKVENYSLHEFDTIGTASLITRTTNDVMQLQQLVVMGMRMMMMAPIMCIWGIIKAIESAPQLTWILAVIIAALLVVVWIVASKTIPVFQILQKKLDRLNLVMREKLTGIRVIRAFNKQSYEKKRFDGSNQDLTDTAVRVNRTVAILMPAVMIGMNLATVAIMWFGSKGIDTMGLELGTLMAFVQYAMQVMFAIIACAMIFVMLPRALASAKRVNEVLDMETEIKDPVVQSDAEMKKGFVEFKNVSFQYPGAEEPTLRDISFKTEPGQVTAIIGGTGSGKSTILNLILRFYDVTQGQVLVNGVDVRQLSQECLRAQISYVPQKQILFSGTVSDNIRNGQLDATEEEIRHAAVVAQADGFISEMENGYGSPIAQGGTNVSGGQRQRLAVARAVIRKAPVYLFDDTFSALDFKTESKLRAALFEETKESAVIIVGQRVSSIMSADQILVLDDGCVVGLGTHKELLDTCEVYREIVESQLSQDEIA